MKIELKNIEYNERMSEETHCFIADLFIQGKLAGTAGNSGHGGNTVYSATGPEGRELISQAEQFCKTLPNEEHTMDDSTFTFEMDLEYYIDKLLEAHLREQEQKKLEEKMKRNIVVSADLDAYYGYFDLGHPIEVLIHSPKGREYLQRTLAAILPQLKENEKIINTNIPEQMLKEAGLQPQQYLPFKQEEPPKKSVKEQKNAGPGKSRGKSV